METQLEQQFYRAGEVARIIGISRSAAYELISRGEIPSVFLGGLKARRVPAAALKAWIADQTATATQSNGPKN